MSDFTKPAWEAVLREGVTPTAAQQAEARGALGNPVQMAISGSVSQMFSQTRTTFSVAVSRKRHVARRRAENIQLIFPLTRTNTGDGENPMDNPVEYLASIELANGTIIPCFYRGKRIAKPSPGGILKFDPVGIELAPGDVFYVRFGANRLKSDTYSYLGEVGGITVDQVYLPSTTAICGAGSGVLGHLDTSTVISSTGVDPFITLAAVDASGALSSQAVNLCPTPMVFGECRESAVTVGIIGTSIEYGQADQLTGEGAFAGWAARAAAACNLPLLNLAVGGMAYQTSWAAQAKAALRGTLLDTVTHVVVGGPTNDFVSGRTFAQAQGDILTIVSRLKRLGKKVYLSTLPPRCASAANNFTTLAAQTVVVSEPNRLLYNAWVRSSPTEADGFIDIGAEVEDIATGKWKPGTLISSGTITGISSGVNDSGASFSNAEIGGAAGAVFLDTADPAKSWGVSHSPAPTLIVLTVSAPSQVTGHAYELWDANSFDGVHPCGKGYARMAVPAIALFSSF